MSENGPELVFIKGLSRQRWGARDSDGRPIRPPHLAVEDAESAAELKAAEESLYYWWWFFLGESREYDRALVTESSEPAINSMAKDFGKVRHRRFERWWFQTGRNLFAEKVRLPRVRKLEDKEKCDYSQRSPKLVLEIPLNLRRSTIVRQINRFLDSQHKGRELNVLTTSTATRQLYAKSRMRLPTIKILAAVWKERQNSPDLEWWEIGEKLRLSPSFIRQGTDIATEISYKQRCMTLVVQRYYRKAEALIHFAARGDFPRIR